MNDPDGNLVFLKKKLKTCCTNLKLKLETAKKNTTPPWTLDDLKKVLKSLKKNKSFDPIGLANEIFHPDVAKANDQDKM